MLTFWLWTKRARKPEIAALELGHPPVRVMPDDPLNADVGQPRGKGVVSSLRRVGDHMAAVGHEHMHGESFGVAVDLRAAQLVGARLEWVTVGVGWTMVGRRAVGCAGLGVPSGERGLRDGFPADGLAGLLVQFQRGEVGWRFLAGVDLSAGPPAALVVEHDAGPVELPGGGALTGGHPPAGGMELPGDGPQTGGGVAEEEGGDLVHGRVFMAA